MTFVNTIDKISSYCVYYQKVKSQELRVSEVNKTSPENEQRRAFGIEALAEDHGVNVVSAVRSYGHLGPFRPRTGVDFRGVRLFDILLRQDQILCSSTVSRGDTSENLYGRWGVVIGSGTVEQAFPYDATTTVVEDEVTSIFLDRLQDVSPDEQIASAIYGRTLYNEINVRASSIAGVYFCINNGEDPGTLDLPAESTRKFIDRLAVPTFLLQDGNFRPLESGLDLSSAGDVLDPTDLANYTTTISKDIQEELVSYLTQNLVLAPRNAVSSGLARGNFAHEYRAKSVPYLYDDFLFEQSRLINSEKRPSLRLYGAMALHQFASRAEAINIEAAHRARRMARTVLSLEEFTEYARRVEQSGHLAIRRDELEYYLETGSLPDHLGDH